MLFGERLAAGGGGARHDQRGRLEPVFDAEPGDAESPAADQDDDKADDGRAKPRLTRVPPMAIPVYVAFIPRPIPLRNSVAPWTTRPRGRRI